MPTALTVSTGLDALSHAFEAIWNKNNNPIIDEIAKIAIKKIVKFLPLVLVDEMNLIYRKKCRWHHYLPDSYGTTKHYLSFNKLSTDIFIWLISWYSVRLPF